jgi:hypothetical protein
MSLEKPPKNSQWERKGKLHFQNNNVILNIPYRISTGIKRKQLINTENDLRELINLLAVSNKGLEIANLDWKYCKVSKEKNKFKISRDYYDEKWTYFIELIEQVESNNIEIIIQKHIDKKNPNSPSKPDSQQNDNLGLSNPEVSIPQSVFQSSLGTLSRFCNLNQVKAFGLEGQDYLSRFSIGEKLNFKVAKNDLGELEACSEEFHGFHLSNKQTHPVLKNIPAYLLLENETGKQIALVRKNQWLQAGASRLTSLTGPFSNIFMKMLNNALLPSKEIDSEGYYCFEICSSTKTQEKFILQSQDPEGLIYLMNLYYFQGNKEALEQAFQHFEWLCNIHPLSETSWSQVIPLLLIPKDFEGVRYFRRRLMAAMAQNQLLVEKTTDIKTKSSELDLMAGLAILDELDHYQNNKNPRERLSIHQEYFLYQCAFERMGRYASEHLPYYPQMALDSLGIETLIEFSGLSSTLAKRYKKIKEKLGITDSLPLSVIRKAVEVYNTPSDIPEFERDLEDPLSKAARVFSMFKKSRLNHLDDLKLEELFTQMKEGSIYPLPSVDPVQITSETIKVHFEAYYSIAQNTQSPNAQKLAYTLKILKGTFDKQASVLADYLEGVLTHPDDFPSIIDLFTARKKVDQKKYSYALELTSTHYKDYPKWYEFFHRLNNVAFGESLTKDIIEPVYQDTFVRYGAYTMAKAAVSNLLPGSSFSSGLVQMGIDMATAAATSTLAEKGVELGQPLKKHLPSPNSFTTELFNEKAGWIRTAKLGAQVLAPFGLMMASAYAFAGTPGSKVEDEVSQQQQSYISYLAYQGLTMVGAAFIRTAFAKAMNKNLGLRDALGPAANSVLHGISKAGNVLKKHSVQWLNRNYHEYLQSLGEPYIEHRQIAEADYSVLENQDKTINTFLDKQFDLVFKEDAPQLKEKNTIDLPAGSDNPVLNENYQKAQSSLTAYSESNPQPTTFRATDQKNLLAVYANLTQGKRKLEKQLKKEKSKLLKLFNTSGNPKKENPTPLSLTAIHALIDKRALGKIGNQAGLTEADLPRIELAAARLDLKTARLHQIERLLTIMSELAGLSADQTSFAYANKMEQLAVELRTKTAFSFTTTPPKLLRKFLRFQAQTKTMLWEKQTENRIRALSGEFDSVVTVEIPGSGKTFFGIPVTAAYESDGSKLILPIFPKQIAGDNMREVHQQLWNIFGKRSHVLQSKREMTLNVKKLKALLALLCGAIQEGEPIQMTKEDSQAFQSIFFDRLHRYRHTKAANTREEKECLILLKRILRIFRQHGEDLPDEAHETYSYRKQLNYPIGSPKTISKELFTIAEACMRLINLDPDLQPLIKANSLTTLNKRHYRKVIKPKIAEQMSRYWQFDIQDEAKRQEFITFVCDKATTVPAWIAENAKLYSEISLVKGILNTLLPMNFKKRAQVEYAASKQGQGEFARPSDGNSHVLESDSICLPYESLIKTFLMLEVTGLNQKQGKKLFEKLKATALQQIAKHNLDYTHTFFYKKFGDIFPSLEDLNQDISEEKIEKFYQNSDAKFLYMRHFIRQQITYWKYSIQNTSQVFAGIFDKHLSCTGTPYNEGTYPAGLKVMRDPLTLGEMLEIFASKCPKDGIRVLEAQLPQPIVEEILHNHFMPNSPFSAIIDGGALFTGLDNETVANLIGKFCQKHRPDIKGIKYYKQDEKGNEQEACLRLEKQEGELKPEQCITYYDQRHGFGANIVQKGHGLCTLGPNHALYKLIQEIFRIRGLKKQERLKAIEELLIQMPMQKIYLTMTKDLMEIIMDRDPKNPAPRPLNIPTLNDIIDYALRNESMLAENENYPAMRQKYITVPRQAVYDKMLDIPDKEFKNLMKIYDEFENLFVTEQEDDPAKLFGLIKSKVSSKEALKQAAHQASKKIQNSRSFTNEEKKAFQENIDALTIPVMPDKITIFSDGKGNMSDALADIGLEQTVQQTAEQNQEVNTSQETENEQETEQQSQIQKTTSFKDWEWPPIADPSERTWLQFSDPAPLYLPKFLDSPLSWFKTSNKCPFFKVQDLLAQTNDVNLVLTAKMFDERLWMSNNFLHRWSCELSEQPRDIGSEGQLDLNRVLIHVEEEEGELRILDMGPLSTQEAKEWRQRLKGKTWDTDKVKTIVWDVSSEIVLNGYPLDKDRLRNHKDLKTLIGQLKFLNGDVDYPNLRETMRDWITESKATELHKAYEHIHSCRGKSSPIGKDIQNIFFEIRKISPDEFL